jgi:hypothetical protein
MGDVAQGYILEAESETLPDRTMRNKIHFLINFLVPGILFYVCQFSTSKYNAALLLRARANK